MIFVVQHHLARADHYDFRLEIDGVLASWAVPKGPSLDPDVRRLAKQVGDHDMEHADFEGLAGTQPVQIWDRGVYLMRGTKTPREGVETGHLSFTLAGHKLHGDFSLVRTGADPTLWLLIKKRDAYASGEDPTVTAPTSVRTGRTMDQIVADG